MISFSDLGRFLAPIKNKIFRLVGTALLTAVNSKGEVGFYPAGNRKNPQRVSFNYLGTLTDIVHSQPFGFEARPKVGTAKVIILSPDGSRSNAFVIMIQDDEFRPDDLSEGDSCLYDDSNIRVWAKNGKLVIGKKGAAMTSTPSATDTELLEILDRFMKVFEGVINLAGTASGASLLGSVVTEIGKLRSDLGNIKGSF